MIPDLAWPSGPRRQLLAMAAALVATGHPRECQVATAQLPPLADYHVRAFTADDGLPVSEVRAVAQDQRGYLYVAGGRGLARFDGYQFSQVALPGPFDGFVRAMARDRRGRLWVMMSRGGGGFVVDDRFTPLQTNDVLVAFDEQVDGTVRFLTDRGLHTLPGDRSAPTFSSAHPGRGVVVGLTSSGSGPIVVTRDTLVGASGSTHEAQPCHQYTGVGTDSVGSWLGCADRQARRALVRLDGAGRSRRFTPTSSAALAAVDVSGWRDSSGGPVPLERSRVYRLAAPLELLARARGPVLVLFLWQRSGRRWATVRDPTSQRDELLRIEGSVVDTIALRQELDFQRILDLAEDREGNLWLGTDRGLLQVVRRRAQVLAKGSLLPEGHTTAVRQASDSALWIGTWGAGVVVLANGNARRRLTTADGLPSDQVRALFEDRSGAMWIGTRRGWAVFAGGRLRARHVGAETRGFAETPNGGLWIATQSGLYRWVDGKARPVGPDGWSAIQPWAVLADSAGLWVGGEHGIRRIDTTGATVSVAVGLPAGAAVVAMFPGPEGGAWLSTYQHGMLLVGTGRPGTTLTTANGLPGNGTWSLLADGGEYWMSGDYGIASVRRRAFDSVVSAIGGGSSGDRLLPVVFTATEGLASREANRAFPAAWRLFDGRLVFNSMNGIVVVAPESATAGIGTPPPVLSELVVDGRRRPVPDSHLRLPPGTRSLGFRFAALAFGAPRQAKYRYRLDGHETGWGEAVSDPVAIYSGLGPGRYAFRVQTSRDGVEWSEDGATASLTIAGWYWQSPIFRGLLGLIGLAAVVTLHRYRVRKAVEVQTLRLRIASDLHDDVGSNLGAVTAVAADLQGRLPPDGPERRQLAELQAIVGQTIASLRDTIWVMHPANATLGDLAARIRGEAARLFVARECTVTLAADLARRGIGLPAMRHLLLLSKEAMHNAARHSGSRSVEVAIEVEGPSLRLRVEDDGRGLDLATASRGVGIAAMARRAREMGGAMTIHPRDGGGTVVEVRVPWSEVN